MTISETVANDERKEMMKQLKSNEKIVHQECFQENSIAVEELGPSEKAQRVRLSLCWVAFTIALLLFGATTRRGGFYWLTGVCRYIGICGKCSNQWIHAQDAPPLPDPSPANPSTPPTIPEYVLEYAPYVYLDEDENYWPGDMAEHLLHTKPEVGYTPIQEMAQTVLNLSNLDQLNAWGGGRYVFLTSKDNVQEHPPWLMGEANIPSQFIEEGKGARSKAPAILITVEKDNGILDAFWFFFYSFNRGNTVLGVRWGNHVGDWEHTLVRFQHGKPQLVFYSEHSFGSAYTYTSVEKIGKRPIVYSAIGTHAMYAASGSHPYILPLGLLRDATSRGPLWDPAQNIHSFTYNPVSDTLLASALTPLSPTPWFYFNGHWGDKFYPFLDPRQYGIIGEYHYVSGPLGPRFKHLGRRNVCQGLDQDPCRIRTTLAAEDVEVRFGVGVGEGEDWSEKEELRPPGL